MKMRFLNVFMLPSVIWLALLTAGCGDRVPRLTAEETDLVMSSGGVMRVLLVTSPGDSLVLRTPCVDLAEEDLQSEVYERLARRMIATVTDSTQDGVGLAAPQVGLNRRVVAVMRYDKPGYPFEVYPNIHIEHFSDQKQTGPEGCLSIPEIAGDVERSQQVLPARSRPPRRHPVHRQADSSGWFWKVTGKATFVGTIRSELASSGASCRNGREMRKMVPLWKRNRRAMPSRRPAAGVP